MFEFKFEGQSYIYSRGRKNEGIWTYGPGRKEHIVVPGFLANKLQKEAIAAGADVTIFFTKKKPAAVARTKTKLKGTKKLKPGVIYIGDLVEKLDLSNAFADDN